MALLYTGPLRYPPLFSESSPDKEQVEEERKKKEKNAVVSNIKGDIKKYNTPAIQAL